MKIFSALMLWFTSCAYAHELTLYFAHSPQGMEWSSPSELLISAARNKLSFKKRFLGHVLVEMKCQGTTEFTGMTAKNFDYLNQLLIGGKGLGILYHSFQGKLENQSEIQAELNQYLKTGEVNFVKFRLNEKQCQRLTQYFREYREKKVDRYYGLAHRPRFGEGAGGAAYAVSFLDVTGVLDQEMKESWSQTINIPLAYAGLPLTENYVGLIKFLFSEVKWAQDTEPHKQLAFWNPDKMFNWVKKKILEKKMGYDIVAIEKAQGVIFDKSHFPAPEGPIWLQQLDPQDKNKTL